MEEKRNTEIIHKLTVTDREKLFITGVEDVESFDDDIMVVYTTDGVMTVKGAGFKISRLNVEDGELEAEGDIDSISYADGHKNDRGGFFGKIFK